LSGKVRSVSDLLLVSPTQIAKQCKITLPEAQSIIDIVCKERAQQSRSLVDVDPEDDEIFTTGDAELDNALGGGIRTGMIWEIAGERYLFINLTGLFRDPERTPVLLGRHNSASSSL
jgi:DNA repair protein RAD57